MQQVPASCPVRCPENYQQKELGLVPSKTILFLFNQIAQQRAAAPNNICCFSFGAMPFSQASKTS
jgi:hypothetical protein